MAPGRVPLRTDLENTKSLPFFLLVIILILAEVMVVQVVGRVWTLFLSLKRALLLVALRLQP